MLAALLAMVAVLNGALHDSQDNRPIRDGVITVDVAGAVFSTKTDADGRFTLVGVSHGPAVLQLEAPGYSPVSVRTCIHEDDVRTLPLKLRAGGSIPQLNAVWNYDNAIVNSVDPSTSDVYYLGC